MPKGIVVRQRYPVFDKTFPKKTYVRLVLGQVLG